MKIKHLNNYLVFLAILILSVIPCYAMFTSPYFISTGHDNVFHFSQIQDLYIAFKRDPFSNLISPTLNHGIGVGTRLMYGSLSHYIVVLLSFIIIPLGGDLMLTYKITILIFYIFSNFIMYKLLFYITKNHSLTLIGVAIYALFPYRFANLYIRNAFSETIVISLLPLILYGLIKWLKEDYRLSSYIMCGLGFITIVHTHNIFALFTLLFILIFLGFNYKKLFNSLKKDKRHRMSFIITCLSILFICAPFFVLLLENLGGNYRVFNSKVMGTDYLGLSSSYNSLFTFIIYAFQANWNLYLVVGLLFLLIPLLVSYFLDKHKYRKQIFLISYGLCAIIASLILNSIYVFGGFALGLLTLFFLTKEANEPIDKNIKRSLTVLAFSTGVLLVFLPIWYILPNIFKNIQFIWRLWGFMSILIACLIPIFLQKFLKNRNRYFTYVISSLLVILTMLSYPVSINDSYFDSYHTINENITKHPNASGWQLEYFPEIFFDDSYKDGSPLFIDIKNHISSEKDVEFEPYIYQGKAMISDYNSSNIPNLTFMITCEEQSIIQLPLLYYKGYRVSVSNDSGVRTLNNYEVDGLLSFDINESGTIKVEYVGSTTYKISRWIQLITFISLLGLGGYYLYQKSNCKKKEKTLQ